MIVKNYHMAVFDRFKRYDERQKELNPINWLDSGFVVPYLSEHAETLQLARKASTHNSIFDYQDGYADEEDFTRCWRRSGTGGMW
ncbi:hypothetical protein N7621_000320 [Salmonella enterica]|uniref:Uncharacterized protein n=2 Tax=Salmonella enterica I TaxID=59201 RepID=A0A3Z3LIA7_SALET|nr:MULTISPECIES: hypothetical protein [Salmonella]EBU7170569.1 hypothetical protein [Salmonella enterica subsp. enterica serovar Enteritidis]ECA1810948.1 hypothetical protein [Salmonella enterica subsp. enterica serovar Derby]EDR7496063.1 hypothetical protein [Salmonella enterica subsp. enterica serovar Kiambu]EDX2777915.1 hypothetical protein [Salmonella enterica subsp. enterica serovar 4,12:nonmotile]RXY94269.1 hypothetical protein DD607_07495 [Salmonella sp. 3DZ2-4SM]